RVQHAWNVTWTQEDTLFTAAGPAWAPGLRAGRSTRFGLVGTATPGSPEPPPPGIDVNGRPCEAPPGPTDPPAANPFAGADGYVNPDWAAQARAAADRGGPLGPAMAAAARQSTAVWLESIASITDGRGL